MSMSTEERVDSLETILGTFIVRTGSALTRLEREMTEFKQEMTAFKNHTNKQWGDLADKMGTVVEDIVAPNIPYVARTYFGVEELDYFAIRARKRLPTDRGVVREFDVIATGGGLFFVNDTKSTPRSEYLQAFAEEYPRAVEFFPEYRDLKLVPIFSSLSLPDEAVTFLTKHGIYAMTSTGGTMEIVNYEQVAG